MGFPLNSIPILLFLVSMKKVAYSFSAFLFEIDNKDIIEGFLTTESFVSNRYLIVTVPFSKSITAGRELCKSLLLFIAVSFVPSKILFSVLIIGVKLHSSFSFFILCCKSFYFSKKKPD